MSSGKKNPESRSCKSSRAPNGREHLKILEETRCSADLAVSEKFAEFGRIVFLEESQEDRLELQAATTNTRALEPLV